MTSLIATALMGFFVYSSVGAGTPGALLNPEIPADEPAYPTYTVSMTGYNAVPEQTKADPTYTASGAYSNPEVVAARSQDLGDELPFGTVIAVTDATNNGWCGINATEDLIGLRVITDTMNARIHNAIDILFPTDANVQTDDGGFRNAANALGMCRGTKIAVLGHIDINHMPKTQSELRYMMLKQKEEQDVALAK